MIAYPNSGLRSVVRHFLALVVVTFCFFVDIFNRHSVRIGGNRWSGLCLLCNSCLRALFCAHGGGELFQFELRLKEVA